MSEELLTKDGRPLSQSLSRALFRNKIRALLLIAPLLLFLLITYIMPILNVLYKSVDNDVVYEIIPQTAQMLVEWEPENGEAPPEEIYESFAQEMLIAAKAREHGRLGVHYNKDIAGVSSKFRKLGRDIQKWDFEDGQPFKDKFTELDEFWGEGETWAQLKVYSARYTAGNFARAIDGNLTTEGFEMRPENERFLGKLFVRTMALSLLITVMTILLGYPLAWLLANVKTRTANLLMIMVLLPFWTSLLVRTASWRVLLQDSGVLNSLFQWLNEQTVIFFQSAPYELMYNQLAVVIAMTHILMPFMILPMYSVMKTINPSYLRAAKSMGATNWTAFWRVYFPLTIPGIGAGAILVFILAVGYYITPAIVGGTDGIFISNSIAGYLKSNQGLGAALATLLLVIVLVLYFIYDRIVGIDNMKLG